MNKLNRYHPVISLPEDYEVYDFSEGYDPNRELKSNFGIGKYNEHRPTMYKETQFTETLRTVHIGIDIAAPIDTPVHAFDDGIIFIQGYNSLPQDYGGTIITKHRFEDKDLFVLHGHLSFRSLELHKEGERFQKGDVIGYVGNKDENGGWNPHLHIQLSWKKPETFDMPGVVSLIDRKKALLTYPDPQLILGQLY